MRNHRVARKKNPFQPGFEIHGPKKKTPGFFFGPTNFGKLLKIHGPEIKTPGELGRCGKFIFVYVFYMFSRENNLIEGLPDSLGIHGPGKKAPGFFFWAPNQNRGFFFGPPCKPQNARNQ